MNTPEYFRLLEKAFLENSDAGNALQMKNYMKGQFEYYGIKSPVRKDLLKQHLKNHGGFLPTGETAMFLKWCWAQPQREWQYVGMELLQKNVKKESQEIIDLYEFMITEKSWWDTIDFIASNLVGVYFQRFPEKIKPVSSRWMDSGNMWLQRSCLLFQLKYKRETDTELLMDFILRLKDSKEFFIRKAIGWILREYSKTDAQFVLDSVNGNSLSGLSEREALKWLKNKNLI